MDANVIINVVEPGTPPTPTPIDPVMPNTGLFTTGVGRFEIVAISVIMVLIMAAIIIAILYKKRNHNIEATKIVNRCRVIAKSKRYIAGGLAMLALLTSVGTLAMLLVGAGKANINATRGDINGETERNLTAIVSDAEITIEVGDEPVFAVLPVDITVEQATAAGYTLTAYADSTDLVSTTDSSKKIPMVVESEEPTALIDDSYGLSLVRPESNNQETYTALSTDSSNPTIITDKNHEATDVNDKTTIYYGFYITPDVPYGTYVGGNAKYDVKDNAATVIFDGNGKYYFADDESVVTNTVNYIPGDREVRYSHTPNVNDEGEQTPGEMYPMDANETFVYEFENMSNVYINIVKTENDSGCGPNYDDYFSIWSGAHPDYTAKNNWETAYRKILDYKGRNVFDNYGRYEGTEINFKDNAVTFAYTTNSTRSSYCAMSGYGYYAKVVGYNPNISVLGRYEKPITNTAYRFLGWSEDKDATEPTYTSQDDIERFLDLASGDSVVLYAISEPAFTISYNGNGADSVSNMDNVEQYSADLTPIGKQVDLLAPNFSRKGYGFVGWSTDKEAWRHLIDDDEDNDPTIYGPNQTITIDEDIIRKAGESKKLALNAIWVPVERDSDGNAVFLQGWQGCSALTATEYNMETGMLEVGKNSITALKDNRDGEIYTIARLADGNCWMTENLRLNNSITKESTTREFSSFNTHNPSLPLTNNYTGQTVSNRLSASSDEWCTEGSDECYNQSIINTDNIDNTVVSPIFKQDFTNQIHKGFSEDIYSYGVYYNWYSATAGHGVFGTGSQETVVGDICPAGWQLPLGDRVDADKSFWRLNEMMGAKQSQEGSQIWRSFPNNLIYSGDWKDSTAIGGFSGVYWSSTSRDNYSAFVMDVYDTGINLVNIDGKYYGSPVRCVAQ